MADRIVAAARTRNAIRAARDGELGDARSLLVEALQADRDYAPAWLWFGAVAEDPGEQLFCLREAQRLEPTRATETAILQLRDAEPVTPDELTAFTDPPPPKLVETFQTDALARRRRRRLIGWSVAAALVVAVLGLLIFLQQDRREAVYFAVVGGTAAEPGPSSGQEVEAAAQWAAERFNEANRLPNRRIEIVYFNDDNDPVKAVEVAREIVADGRFLGVIGHQTSATSEVAGPVYAEAKLPVITASATGDGVSTNNPWYFRTIFDNSQEGIGMSDYATAFLDEGSAALIYSENSYGTTLAGGFRGAWTKDAPLVVDIPVAVTAAGDVANPTAVADIVAQIESAQPTGPIAIAAGRRVAEPLVAGLRSAGLTNPIIGGDAISAGSFYSDLTSGDDAIDWAAIGAVYSATPLTSEGLTGEAVTFYDDFSAAVGYPASWEAGLVYDAVDVFSEALLRAGAPMTADTLADDRELIRQELDLARSPETAFKALTHPIHFDENGSAVRPVAFDWAPRGTDGTVRPQAAPNQLVSYSPAAGLTLEQAQAKGIAVVIDGRAYTRQRIVEVGVNLNEVSTLDTANQTFNADFFIWLRYQGSDDAADIAFPNALNPDLDPGDPVRKTTVGDDTYVLYAVEGEFSSSMQFKDFPFDHQQLLIQMGNKTLPAAQVAYTIDPDLLLESQATRLTSGVDSAATIDSIPNWIADAVNFYPKSVGNTSTLGDPTTTSGPSGVTYSQFVTDVSISRDVSSFLVKNILPLVLLVIVTYLSLWLPIGESARVSFAVTGILTGAVMLNSVTNSLADVEYTVAIEWAYYAFIALSGIMLLLTLIGRHYSEQRRLATLRKVISFSRIFFPIYVAATALAYVVAFG